MKQNILSRETIISSVNSNDKLRDIFTMFLVQGKHTHIYNKLEANIFQGKKKEAKLL